MKKSRLLYIGLSCGATGLLLWILFSRVGIQDLFELLGQIHKPYLVIFLVISLFNTGLRAWRYLWLLQPRPIRFSSIFLVTLIRNLFVDLLPARTGSLSYIYILNRRLNFSFESAASSFLFSILLDFITLGPFLVIAIISAGMNMPDIPASFLLLSAAGFFLLVFLLFRWFEEAGRLGLRALQLFSKKAGIDKKRVFHLIEEKWMETLLEIRRVKKRRIQWPLFFLSLLIRATKYTALYFLLASLLKSQGFFLRQVSFWKTVLGITGAEMTSILPVKGIGGFGTWESAWALTFRLMHFDERLAVLSGLGIHLVSNAFEYTLGITAIILLMLPFLKTKPSAP